MGAGGRREQEGGGKGQEVGSPPWKKTNGYHEVSLEILVQTWPSVKLYPYLT